MCIDASNRLWDCVLDAQRLELRLPLLEAGLDALGALCHDDLCQSLKTHDARHA